MPDLRTSSAVLPTAVLSACFVSGCANTGPLVAVATNPGESAANATMKSFGPAVCSDHFEALFCRLVEGEEERVGHEHPIVVLLTFASESERSLFESICPEYRCLVPADEQEVHDSFVAG